MEDLGNVSVSPASCQPEKEGVDGRSAVGSESG